MEYPASTPKVVPDVSFLAELISSDSRALLDTIDGLKKIQVGDDKANLPKVIVVGNRSSGKSSVLEAITGIQFPIDRVLCTRFATELILRRADEIAVNVSIQYAERPPSGAQGGGGAREPFHKATFDEDALPNIIKEAKERMGICDNGTQKFSRDVLLIEVARPDVYPLTLVDLPGISHSTAADQSLEDQSIVNQLIESYMKKPNCIILAVVAANDHLVDQKVLQEARKHDPKWERTIGVITKPDLPCSHEREYLDLANGRNNMHSGTLGWHVLRNMSGQERSSGDEHRDTIEERFFKSGTWSSINPANRGVKSLRRTLSKAILGQIKTCLPKLIQDIKNKLKIRQEDLARLGKARSGTEEQRSYLLGIADEYQRLARDAIEGRYRANPGFFGGIGQTATKLRAELRNRNRAFHVIMETNGGRFRILREGGDYASTELAEPNDELPGHLRQLIKEYSIRDPEPKDESTLKADLQSQACFSRGGELPGEAVEELALQLFREQIEPWHDIAWMHLRETLKVVQAFVHRAFIDVIGADEQVEEAILTRYVDPFFDKKEEDLRCKLEELLLPYSSGYGPLLEAEFILGMRSMAERRRLQHDRPKRLQQQSCGVEFSQGECLSEDRPLAFRDLEDPERNECCTEKAIDWMTVYYEMSLRTFTDNIINLAVEGCLVRDIPTILTPRDVCGMAPETLEALASESQESRSQRQWLEREVRILQEGLRECQRHERRSLPMRPTTSVHLFSGAGPGQTKSATATPSSAPTSAPTPTPLPTAATKQQPTSILRDLEPQASRTSFPPRPAGQGQEAGSAPFGSGPAPEKPLSSFGSAPATTKPVATSVFATTATRPQDGNIAGPTGNDSTGRNIFSTTRTPFGKTSTPSTGSGFFGNPSTTGATASLFGGASNTSSTPGLSGNPPKTSTGSGLFGVPSNTSTIPGLSGNPPKTSITGGLFSTGIPSDPVKASTPGFSFGVATSHQNTDSRGGQNGHWGA